jgi:uncharacterized protein YdcH (DUF465 family)
MERHDLLNEFPEHKEKIHLLKMTDAHFKKLFDNYNDVDHDIHRIETGAEAVKDEVLNDLRAKRVSLKDQIANQLTIN